jgi:hypothetical protein
MIGRRRASTKSGLRRLRVFYFSLLSLVCVGGALGLAPSALAAAPPPVLYGAVGGFNATSQLYSIDPATGAGTPIGDIGNAVTGLAEDPTTGVLYGVTSNETTTPNTLITINKSTGAGTIVGPLGKIVADISFNSSGQLFGWSEDDDGLVTIDKTTGTATVVGATGLGTRGDGLSFDKNDVLFDMSKNDNGALWTVDTSTGVPTTVATLNGGPDTGNPINSASFGCDRTTLYAVDGGGNESSGTWFLVTVNTSTGAVTTIGTTVPGLDALEWSCPQQVGFTTSAVTVNQSAGTATLTLTRTGGMKGAVSVDYSTANGTATAGTDYTAKSGTVTWANNDQSNKTITVPIKFEGPDATESFKVNLSNPTAGATLGIATATVTINGIPSATTGPANSVTAHSANVTGTVNPNGVAATYHFEYGTSTTYGHSTAATSAGSGTSPVSVAAHLSGLHPGAIYHYRLVVTSASGTSMGVDRTFHTKALIAVSGVSATGCMSASSASLRVRVTSFLRTRGTTVKLDGHRIAHSGSGSLRVRLALSGLHAGRHTITVTTTSRAGTTTRSVHFRTCAAAAPPPPKFTG